MLIQQAVTTGRQVLLMFLLILVGWSLSKTKLTAASNAPSITNILLYAIMPATILMQFQRPFSQQEIKNWATIFVFSVVAHSLGLILSLITIKDNVPDAGVERLAIVLTNSSFMAIPLLIAIMGPIGGFYSTGYFAVNQIFSWAMSEYQFKEKGEAKLWKFVVNPSVLALILAVILYFSQITITGVVGEFVTQMSLMNTPLAMINIGILLSEVDIGAMFKNKRVYFVSFLRMIVTPLLVLAFLLIIGTQRWLVNANPIIMTTVLAAGCPTAASAVLFAVKYNQDSRQGARVLALTTLFSVISLPILNVVVNLLFPA